MKKTLVTVASALVLVVVLAPGASAATVPVGAKANGKTVNAKVGDLVQITLQSNASTGYSWEVVGITASKLSVRGAVTTPPKAGTVGSPGTYTLTLRVRAAGSSTVKLQYVGPPRAYVLGKSFTVTVSAR